VQFREITMPRRIHPWQDTPCGPCGCGPCIITSLEPYNPNGWHGPRDSTLFCHACGTGWIASDAQLEQALVAEVWWDAVLASGKSKAAFLRSQRPRDSRAEKSKRWERRNNRELFEVTHG
jgi:hypothetical protein